MYGTAALRVWILMWQLAAHSPLLARAHLFYAGFREEVDDMLVSAQGKEGGKRRGQQHGGAGRRAVIQVMNVVCLLFPVLC